MVLFVWCCVGWWIYGLHPHGHATESQNFSTAHTQVVTLHGGAGEEVRPVTDRRSGIEQRSGSPGGTALPSVDLDEAAAAAAQATALAAAEADEERLQAAIQAPVLVAIMTGHYFGRQYARVVPNCTYAGRPLVCEWVKGGALSRAADVLCDHAPALTRPDIPPRAHPLQLRAIMSMEGSGYYPQLNDEPYMAAFDVEMTYRMCSQVPVHYLMPEALAALQNLPLSADEKIPAIVYINRHVPCVGGCLRVRVC
ncbi:hypothetical protein FOA52_003811 [Chlamydomonas sp. UWO 241]|nr:hypothetical protein FOA52_003811 [Chlamydomonas sp. UWO 241]